MTDKPERPTVKIVKPTYQPSKEELEADLRVDATFEEAVQALSKNVNIEHVESLTGN